MFIRYFDNPRTALIDIDFEVILPTLLIDQAD